MGINSKLLRRKTAVTIDSKFGGSLIASEVIEAFRGDLKVYGYKPSNALLVAMAMLDVEAFNIQAYEIIAACKSITGANVTHKPMYKNYPIVMREYSSERIAGEQLIGYLADAVSFLSGGDISIRELLNLQQEQSEIDSEDRVAIEKTIKLISKEDAYATFTEIMQCPTPLSLADKEDLSWFFANAKTDKDKAAVISCIPEIKIKETMVYVCLQMKEHGYPIDGFPFSTATDLLRFIIGDNEGDISLSKKCKFKNIPRAARRQYLSALEFLCRNNISHVKADIKRHSEQWKRLNEKLHSGDYITTFPLATECLRELSEGKLPASFASLYNSCIEAKNCKGAVGLLCKKPGEFARRLCHVLSVFKDDTQYILDSFQGVVDNVPFTTVMNIYGFFAYGGADDLRFAVLKGGSRHMFNSNNVICEDLRFEVADILMQSMHKRLASKDPMGTVYISEATRDIYIPTTQRHASKGARVLPSGSRLAMPDDTEVARLFLHWKGENDVDLSAIIYDEEFNWLCSIDFTNYRLKEYSEFLVHSGDITFAPNGASEFIDVDLQKLKKAHPKARYISCSAFSYSGDPFKNIEECFVGVMSRVSISSDEPFDPKTVVCKLDLQQERTSAIVALYDVVENKLIHIDMASGNRRCLSNKDGNNERVLWTKNAVRPPRISLYELALTNVLSRGGTLVDEKTIEKNVDGQSVLERADCIIDFDEDICPFDMAQVFSSLTTD